MISLKGHSCFEFVSKVTKDTKLSATSIAACEVSINPITPVKRSTSKQTASYDPDGKRSSECGLLINRWFTIEGKVELKDTTYVNKTNGKMETLMTCSPVIVNYEGKTKSWSNAGRR